MELKALPEAGGSLLAAASPSLCAASAPGLGAGQLQDGAVGWDALRRILEASVEVTSNGMFRDCTP